MKVTEDIIFDEFKKRSPNTIDLDLLRYIFPDTEKEDLKGILDSLVSKGIISEKPTLNRNEQSARAKIILVKKDYQHSYELTEKWMDIFFKEDLEIAGVRTPRVLDGSPVRGEIINFLVENIVKYNNLSQENLKTILKKERDGYFASIITLFGVFIAIFALINISLNKIQINHNYSWQDILWLNFVQIIPATIMLSVFVIVLHFTFKRK